MDKTYFYTLVELNLFLSILQLCKRNNKPLLYKWLMVADSRKRHDYKTKGVRALPLSILLVEAFALPGIVDGQQAEASRRIWILHSVTLACNHNVVYIHIHISHLPLSQSWLYLEICEVSTSQERAPINAFLIFAAIPPAMPIAGLLRNGLRVQK